MWILVVIAAAELGIRRVSSRTPRREARSFLVVQVGADVSSGRTLEVDRIADDEADPDEGPEAPATKRAA